ncbi:DUF5134 domain-containing protein [Mycobacterium angelicum]|uniref:DUF5134 domain-containing protein n=1 Tax=Mycobacterium angelicum TaxID=470074 RepID=UPI001474DE9A|nr:DUF5134 domain-containing protein [Mycobacterium angelicum]MCV7199183.1 DUF5134 domain-containing protein [Mycobacterium angelicum]
MTAVPGTVSEPRKQAHYVIADLALRWLVTGLSLLSGTGFLVLIDRRSWISALSHGWHVAMAIAMAVMAWPQGLALPVKLPEAFFLVGGLWFVMTAVVAARRLAQRLVCGYGAATMFAMTWMYAVHGQLRPGHVSVPEQHHGHHHMVPGEEMTATDVHAAGDWPGWIDAGNGIWTAVFVCAALAWSYWFVTQRGARRRRRLSLATAVQAMMAAAMAIMFGTTLLQG